MSRNVFNSLLTPRFVQRFSGNSYVNLFAVYFFKYKLLIKISSLSLNTMMLIVDNVAATKNTAFAGKRMKFATKSIRHYPSHLRHVATIGLPLEIKNSTANIQQIWKKRQINCILSAPILIPPRV